MRKRELTKYRKLLITNRKRQLEEMGIMETQLGSTIKEATGDLSSYSYHMADQGTDAMEREITFMMASKSGRLVYHIDEALRRMEKGTYGKCCTCEKKINPARLEAVPHARFCIECKSAEEGSPTERK